MDEASGFFETPTMAQHPRQGMFELVSSSLESYCDIWRADKDGRFRIYKALKVNMPVIRSTNGSLGKSSR